MFSVLLHSLGMQNIYLFSVFLQLKKEATSSSTMPSVVHVVDMVYTPSCTKGKEVNNFFNSQFQFICCCNHTSHIKCSHIQCIHAHMYYYLQYACNLSLFVVFILMLGLLIANCTYPVAVTGLMACN